MLIELSDSVASTITMLSAAEASSAVLNSPIELERPAKPLALDHVFKRPAGTIVAP
jgi:hypothetical protein